MHWIEDGDATPSSRRTGDPGERRLATLQTKVRKTDNPN